ncbi:hypothetical protein FXN63_23715 [Pigmentiphaga aceris]|uniref:Uncharacterized protein n=1 Tax=Pigmentiphaga aceris TaxID=1940612 RepID=A0A5C0B1D0_9BURK|nr:hypothetical protein [Pigmentiphaga aceris]QEI08508.1 hypothetical protein FXN63_23715 [Pigmentiphaga aceris]
MLRVFGRIFLNTLETRFSLCRIAQKISAFQRRCADAIKPGKQDMTVNLIRTLVAVVFLAGPAAHAAEPRSPQYVTDLFFKTLVVTDTTAMTALNDYLRANRIAGGFSPNFIDVAKMVNTDEIYPTQLAGVFLKQLSLDDAGKKAIEPDVIAMFRSQKDAQKRTVCTFGEAEPVTEKMAEHKLAVKVAFDCKVAKVPEKLKAFLQRTVTEKWSTVDQYRQGMVEMRKGFEQATLTQEWKGHFPLVAAKKDMIWQNMFPRETFDASEFFY